LQAHAIIVSSVVAVLIFGEGKYFENRVTPPIIIIAIRIQ